MLEVENLTRVFRPCKKQPGFWGGVKGLLSLATGPRTVKPAHRTSEKPARTVDVRWL